LGKELIPALLLFALFLALAFLQYFSGLKVLEGSLIGTVNRSATFDVLLQLMTYALFFVLCVKVLSDKKLAQQLCSCLIVLVFILTMMQAANELSPKIHEFWIRPGGEKWILGPLVNENHFGGLLGLLFPLVFATLHYRFYLLHQELEVSPRKASLGTYLYRAMDSGIFYLIFLVVLTLSLCFFMKARFSAAVLLFCSFLYLAGYGVCTRKVRYFVVLGLVGLLTFLMVQGMGFDRVLEAFDFQELKKAWDERLLVAKESLDIGRAFPWFGCGLGTYAFISWKYLTAGTDLFLWDHAHNDYVELFAETGLVGFGLFLAMIGSILVVVLFQRKPQNSQWSRLMMVQGFMAVFNIALMEAVDFHLKIPVVALIFIFQLALLYRSAYPSMISHAESHEAQPQRNFKMQPWILSILLISVSVFVFIHSTKSIKVYGLSEDKANRIEKLQEAVRLQPENAKWWYELGESYFDQIRSSPNQITEDLKRKTIAAFRKAVSLSPTYAHYWFILGRVQYALGEKEEGIDSLKGAIEWAPAKSVYALHLISVYLKASEQASLAGKRAQYLEEARLLYEERIKPVKKLPLRGEQLKWMGRRYYDRLQELAAEWNL